MALKRIGGFLLRFRKIKLIVYTLKRLIGFGPKVEQEELSYKSLIRMIETYHPTNPETREKFSPFDQITVYNYGIKLLDACGMIQIVDIFMMAKSKLKKALNLKKEKKFKMMLDSGNGKLNLPSCLHVTC